MEVTLNGTKHTIPDDSTDVAMDKDGQLWAYNNEPMHNESLWFVEKPSHGALVGLYHAPKDFTKCCAKVFDGAVIDFKGM